MTARPLYRDPAAEKRDALERAARARAKLDPRIEAIKGRTDYPGLVYRKPWTPGEPKPGKAA